MFRHEFTRRTFLIGSLAAAAGCVTTGNRVAPRRISPNEKLNVAGIGVGGKGQSDIWECRSENIVALCDVDHTRAAETFAQFPNAKVYTDYRVMLDKHPEIDAVTVSTPDHSHAHAALTAMAMGKHVYVQKPLTHNVYEARVLTEAARRYGVATQMGNQGHSGEGVRRCVEMVRSGVIGPIHEVHCWTDRPGVEGRAWWPQAVAAPLPAEPVPTELDWDLWLNVSPERPYNKGYAPFSWRGWWDFGCGALGDMACHVMDPAIWALELGAPTSVEIVSQEGNTAQSGPLREVIRYEFPQRGAMPPVTLYWYDGGNKPPHPEGVPANEKLGSGSNGSYFVGRDGVITLDTYGENARLLPASRMADYTPPPQSIPRVAEMPADEISDAAHRMDWIRACKSGDPAGSNFDYSGPFTET
ncbi:MAG: Gfo/Idh/MocA family oxidoreductase, partial [Candidatus Hydrogenedentales bacterium]